ncbi:MAG: NAD-dependent epimerase/dehydratase family protein [Gammaproteobacteria bacterium]
MRVLITGGTGFIGSALARSCAARGDEVTVFGQANNENESRRAEELAQNGFGVILGSVLDAELLGRACAVIHVSLAV